MADEHAVSEELVERLAPIARRVYCKDMGYRLLKPWDNLSNGVKDIWRDVAREEGDEMGLEMTARRALERAGRNIEEAEALLLAWVQRESGDRAEALRLGVRAALTRARQRLVEEDRPSREEVADQGLAVAGEDFAEPLESFPCHSSVCECCGRRVDAMKEELEDCDLRLWRTVGVGPGHVVVRAIFLLEDRIARVCPGCRDMLRVLVGTFVGRLVQATQAGPGVTVSDLPPVEGGEGDEG